MLKKIPLLFVSLLLTLSVSLPAVAYADETTGGTTVEVPSGSDDTVRSFKRDYFMGIFSKTISKGGGFLDDDDEERALLNYQILTGAATGVYSLYDRFGGNITIPIYLGEEEVSTSAFDKIYSYVGMSLEDDISFSSVWELITSSSYSYTNIFYQNRPGLKSDGSDPRVNCYSISHVELTGNAGIANYHLNISKAITQLTAYFVSDDFMETAAEVVEDFLDSYVIDVIGNAVTTTILILLLIFTLFGLVRILVQFLKGGVGFMAIVKFAVPVLLSVGIITVALNSPKAFFNATVKLMTLGEEITATVLNETNEDNEIVSSSVNDNVIAAFLWQDSVFYPWVRVTFGGVEYDELYTTFSDADDDQIWELSSLSATSIGDISVPRSSNSEDDVKNWAALAYSTSSYYHLPSVASEREAVTIDSSDDYDYLNWPKATLVGSSSYIYIDDFRWIDALTKVGSYEGTTDSSTQYITSYSGTREYYPDFSAADDALIMGLLLLPLLYIGLKKAAAAILCYFNFATLLLGSMGTLISPYSSKYSIAANLKRLLEPIILYLFYILVAFITMELYHLLATGGIPQRIIYVCLALYLCMLKPEGLKYQLGKIRESISVNAGRIRDERRRYRNEKLGISSSDTELQEPKVVDIRRGDESPEGDKVAVVKTYDAASYLNCSYLQGCKINKEDEYRNHSGLRMPAASGIPNEYKRGATAKITPNEYLNWEKSAKEKGVQLTVTDKADYTLLVKKIRSAGCRLEVFHIINDYRRGEGARYLNKSHRHVKCDQEVFGYDTTYTASNSLISTETNILFDREVRDQRFGDTIMNRRVNDKAALLQKQVDETLKRREELMKQKKYDVVTARELEKQLKQQEKQIGRLQFSNAMNGIQIGINTFTGNRKGGSFVPPTVKFIIIPLIVLALYFIGRIYAYLLG